MRSERLEYLDFYRSELGVAKHCTKSFGYAVWQHQQTKVDELQSMFVEQARTASNQQAKIDELQNRVDELEAQLVEWKQKSMPLMLNGMCGSCGKEPLQGVVSDRVDYALLHCFGCGANKYEFVGEQALKGGEE